MFSFFRRVPNKISFGRFDAHTSERHNMIKAILANSDNCGDQICGDPKLVKNIIEYGDDRKDGSIQTFETYHTYKEHPEMCCQFYNFDKCSECHLK